MTRAARAARTGLWQLPNLAFEDAAQEADYRAWNHAQMSAPCRGAALFGAIAFTLFGLKDILLFPPAIAWVSASLQIGLIAPALLVLRVMYDRLTPERAQTGLKLAWLVSTIPLIWIIAYGHLRDFVIPYEGLIVVTLFICLLTGIRPRPAVALTTATTTVFLVAMLWVGQPAQTLVLQIFYLATTGAAGCVGAQLIDRSSRARYQSELRLTVQARIDALTNLPNRRAAEDAYETAWRLAQRNDACITVLYADIDYFKRLNDCAGHAAGDAALKAVADALAHTMQRPLDFVGRLGGEEFIALAYGLEAGPSHQLAEKLRAAVEEARIAHPDSPLGPHVTVSLGVTRTTPQRDQPPDFGAWVVADKALYRAKQAGRNAIHVL